MDNGWTISRIKDLVRPRNITIDYLKSGQKFIPLEDVEKFNGRFKILNRELDKSNKLFKPGDVCVNKLRPYLTKVINPSFEGACSSEMVVFSPKSKIMSRFLFYFCLNQWFIDQMSLTVDGVKMPRAKPSGIMNILTRYPSLKEQASIANFLDEKTGVIDSAVEELVKQRKLLEELKQATIHKAVTKGLDDNVEMKDSGIEWIGEIPKDWELVRWKNILKILNGFAFKSDDHCDDGIPIVKMSNLKKGKLYLDNAQRVKRDKLHSSYFLKEGDLLLGMSGSIENFAFVSESDGECLLNQRVCKIIPIKTTNKYISYFIQGNIYRSKIKINAQGTAIMNLSTEDLKNMEIPLPNRDFQVTIVKYLDDKISKIDNSLEEIELKIEYLKEYKKTLINDAVTGKIKVYEGEK